MTASNASASAAILAIRRLAARERRDPGETGALLPGALYDVVAPVLANLRAALGDDGCSALMSRAFARAQWEHPAVATIRGPKDCDVSRENIVSAIDAHGAVGTANALEAVLVTLFEILARIIGEDMAIGIMDQASPGGNGASS